MPKYAYFDSSAVSPVPVKGWYDTDGFSYPNMPAAADLLMVTDDQYASRMQNPTGWAVRDGTDLVAYTPPAPSLTLAQQAQAGLNNARAYVQSTYLILNEATPDAWVAYIKALMAIANGTDAAATALPVQPAP